MVNILDLSYEELEEFLVELGEKKFRTKQVWQWLWNKYVQSFDEMTNISKTVRARLHEAAYIRWPEVVTSQTSKDGTIKFLLKLHDGALVETVLIPGSKGRYSQCLSCQVGCAMACTFCSTGTMGFKRNMTQSEILGQILVARHSLNDVAERPILRNIVFMGMGEPLLNLETLLKSLNTMHSTLGLAFSPRRVTVSTCGIQKGLNELGESGLAFLAVSLHAPNQEVRAKIMPKAARWELNDLMHALKNYPLKTRERITYEYLLLGGVNDSVEDARELHKLISQTKSKLNLIVYNPAEGDPYKAPSEEAVLKFQKILWDKGVTAIIRQSKGADIKAACGQLVADQNKKDAEC
ncbi:23S rRNA (adenine(2503)-C(2))-methyltransferase RlmN [Halodesulfovibrio sp. MK-HDV]|jgi:23S rRNA (adenine2503-C2)-methyltransferase|uniref:23S rRNA (adenine(2503)-C(2))-methyltransferase RlmN n=1 Tax=unclassified Halodesulfovibrio TaxID=2644657 RepID=UPI001371F4D0|nr:23S rRNA (adenine(2503)-C(2))-methyltransferase RlmN [Halodesulfovibrio sp. MK-HDV]KAF1076798.1 Dual-specificity RNA methyltransferase RlmN [Halodesulfovibrio sp. MK-HDV]